MTREEIWSNIEKLSELRSKYSCFDEKEEPFYHALSLGIKGIKALEQEPCDDAISRQAVDTLVDELARTISDERCCVSRGRSTATIMQDILDLPSVRPQEPKTGHWIKMPIGFKCSNCNELEDRTTKYCPNCGDKKVEPQESEE